MKTIPLSSLSNMTPRMQSHARLARKMEFAFILGFDTLVASWGSSIYFAAALLVWAEFGVSTSAIPFLSYSYIGARLRNRSKHAPTDLQTSVPKPDDGESSFGISE